MGASGPALFGFALTERWFHLFIAAVLGGIGNIPGAALGGLIIGVTETLVGGYSSTFGLPTGYKDGVAFVILILILLFKPSGLLGKTEREKV